MGNGMAYCHNDPVNYIDPFGLFDEVDMQRAMDAYKRRQADQAAREKWKNPNTGDPVLDHLLKFSRKGRRYMSPELERIIADNFKQMPWGWQRTRSRLFGIIGWSPFGGDCMDGVEAFSGYDVVTKKKLSRGQRAFAFGMLLLPLVSRSGLMGVVKGAKKAGKPQSSNPMLPGYVNPKKAKAKTVPEGTEGAEEGEKLWRGIPPSRPKQTRQARHGTATPRGSDLSKQAIANHCAAIKPCYAGVTSWTESFEIAVSRAGPDGIILEISKADFSHRFVPRVPVFDPKNATVDKFAWELERLISGQVTGARRIYGPFPKR